jgi:ankyrin repeat protein
MRSEIRCVGMMAKNESPTAEIGGFLEIHWSAYNDEIDKFREISQRDPCQLLTQSKNGNNCLHVAAGANSLRVLRYLMDLPIPTLLESVNSWGETPLHVSAAAGNREVLNILLEAGANCLLRDRWGRTPKTVSGPILFL